MTVRQYQDIDGCLNATFNARKWRQEYEEEDEYLFGECEGVAEALYGRDGLLDPQGPANFRMKWNSRLVDALNAMDVELVWTTTWRNDAFRVGLLMGLTNKNVRVLHPKSGWSEFPSIYWKYEAIVAEQKNNPSPFIWIDDEIVDLPAPAIARIVALGGLMICPDAAFGMTPSQVEMMNEYIASH